MDEVNGKYGMNTAGERHVAAANVKDALEDRMDVIGQKGKDGLHYDQSEFPDEKGHDHYNLPIQHWEYMESTMGSEDIMGELQGNVIK